MGGVRRPSPPARRLAAALLGVLTAVALTAASCSDRPRDITVGNVSRADVTEVVDASATVTAKGVATLSAPAEGTLAPLAHSRLCGFPHDTPRRRRNPHTHRS